MRRLAIALGFAALPMLLAGETSAVWTSAQPISANSFTTVALVAPGDLAATTGCESRTSTFVELAWTAAPGADSYDVYRSKGNGNELVATVTAAAWTDTGLPRNKTYTYEIVSKRATWVSPDVASITVLTPKNC
jgi:hypothetical protein